VTTVWFPVAAMSSRDLKLVARYRGHKDAILSLAISTDGQILASGGKWTYYLPDCTADKKEGLDGIKLWDIRTGKDLKSPEQNYELRGPPSAIVWAKRRDDQHSILVIGMSLGYLVLWNQSRV
jgi:hypothetical protein